MNHSNMLLKRIVIFITLTVFTVTSHCTVLAYDGATGIQRTTDPAASDTADILYSDEEYPYIDSDDPAVQDLIKDIPLMKAPAMVTAFPTTTGIRIYWTEVEGADGYKVFRKAEGNKNWKEITEESPSVVRFTDKSLSNGKKYTYAVCACEDVAVTMPAEAPGSVLLTAETPETTPSLSEEGETPEEPGTAPGVPEEDEILEEPETTPSIPEEGETPETVPSIPAENEMSENPETSPSIPEEPAEEEEEELETFYVTIDGNRKQTESIFWLSPSTVKSFTKNDTTLTATWKANKMAAGYQVEYATNRFFEDASALTLTGAYSTSITLTDLSPSSEYYIRVRGYTTDGGVTQYAQWRLSSNAKAINSVQALRITHTPKKKTIPFELRTQAGYKVGKCDTLQGGCTDGTYGYFVLYNRNKQVCRIIKVQMNTMEVVKRSRALKIYHGNDMAYNPDRNQLIAIYGQPYYKKVAIIDPATLKITETRDLNLTTHFPGMTNAHRHEYTGITSIAYNTKYQQYVARIQGKGNLLFFDQDFNPVRYVYLAKKGGQTYQGMDTAGDYILVGQSYASGKPYNIITVYDWSGAYISTVNVRQGYELENVFHANGVFYAGFYTAGYEYVTVTKYKTKKVRGKKKRVKVKVKQQRLYRNNYIYKILNI